MKKSKKVVDYLIAGGEILTVPAGILAIIGILFYVAGYKEISLIIFIASVAICVVALLLLVPLAIVENTHKTKIEKTIAEDVKRLFDLDIGERFLLKKEVYDMTCFINKEGGLVDDFDGISILKYYDTIPIDYKMLKILTEECGYSIEKTSKKVDKETNEDCAE